MATPKKATAAAKVAAPNALRPMEDLIQVRLARLCEIINQLARHSTGARGLRNTDLRIMNLLYDSGMLSINELARRAHVDKAWISRSVMQLLAKRWVSKQPNPFDARAQLISLTPKSRELLEKVRPQVLGNEKSLLTDINETKMKKLLDQLLSNAEQLLDIKNNNKG